MSYSTNPSLEKARGKAMKLLFIDELSVQTVADRYGVNRSTIWRWKKKWLEVNPNIELRNYSKQRDNPTSLFRCYCCRHSGIVHDDPALEALRMADERNGRLGSLCRLREGARGDCCIIFSTPIWVFAAIHRGADWTSRAGRLRDSQDIWRRQICPVLYRSRDGLLPFLRLCPTGGVGHKTWPGVEVLRQ